MSVDESFPPYVNFLNSSAITGDTPVTIKNSEMATIPDTENEGKTVSKPILRFKELESVLVLNRTNIETLRSKIGKKSSSWADRKIVLYLEDTQFGAKKVKGIRIRVI